MATVSPTRSIIDVVLGLYLPDLSRLAEIDLLETRERIPAVRNGHPLQFYKFRLSCRLRAVRLRKHVRLSEKQKRAMYDAAPEHCPVCGVSMHYWVSRRHPSIDHIVPVAKGGTDDPENLRVICNCCNSGKGGR